MKKASLLLLIFLLLNNCAKQPLVRYKKEHQDYLIKVKHKKESSSPTEYQSFVKSQIQKKEMELTNLQTIKDNAQMRHSESESQQTLNEGDINYFKANSARVELHQIDTRIKIIEKELFFLKSQLSSLN